MTGASCSSPMARVHGQPLARDCPWLRSQASQSCPVRGFSTPLRTDAALGSCDCHKVRLSLFGGLVTIYPAHFYVAQAFPLRDGFAVANSSVSRPGVSPGCRSNAASTLNERVTRLGI